MKKAIFRGIIVCFTALIVSGCFSTPAGKIVYDPELSAENTTYVVFCGTIFVQEYNGINVSDTWYPRGKLRVNRVTLPAGDTTVGINIRGEFSRGNTIYTIRIDDVQLKYDFEQGKEYTIGLYIAENTGNFLFPKNKIMLAIWGKAFPDGSPGRTKPDLILKSWELGEV